MKADDPFFKQQSKLHIVNQTDTQEKEADTASDGIREDTKNTFFGKGDFFKHTAKPSEGAQRKTNPASTPQVQKMTLRSNESDVQAKEESTTEETHSTTFENQLASQTSGGRKMDERTREEMEGSFGQDFSKVQIHNDQAAVEMNQELGAHAFTNGNDIYFNKGKYEPRSNEGKRLLAHELTHTIQQGGSKNKIAMKRDPNAEDKSQLTKFEVYLALFDAEREQKVESIAKRTEQLIPQLEESLARTDISADERAMLLAHKKDREDTWSKELQAIDDAILAVKYERLTYKKALERAHSSDKIVWHSSSIGAGWVSERESYMLHEMANDPFYQLGKRHGMYFARLRAEGTSFESAFAKLLTLVAGDLTGISGVVEGISGRDIATDQKLTTEERLTRGIVGILSLATISVSAGPRVASWAKQVGGTKFRVMQTTAGSFQTVLVVGEAGAVLALTQAEILTMAAAGLLNVNALQMSALGSGQPVSGLNNASRGKPRGGGGSAADQAYSKKVNKENGSVPEGESVYVDGVEFDGYNPTSKSLLDSKRSKGKGSWYDISGTNSFTQNVKIPEILKQARRQIAVLGKSGATKIEWHVSDSGIAAQLKALFNTHGINIIVKHTAP